LAWWRWRERPPRSWIGESHAINASLQAPELRGDASCGPIPLPEGYGKFMRRQAQIWQKVSAIKLELTH
jgi:hypothetical protein